MAYKPLKFAISDAWAEQLVTVGLIDVGSFTPAELKAAGVATFQEPRKLGHRRRRPKADVGILAADEPNLTRLIGAVSQGSFLSAVWYRAATSHALEPDASGPAWIAKQSRDIDAFILVDGRLAVLVGTDQGEVWQYTLATLEVAAEQLAAAVFAPAGDAEPDAFVSGWLAGWPTVGITPVLCREDVQAVGRDGVAGVRIDRTNLEPREEELENIDMEALAGIYLNSFRKAVADVVQPA
ncbi:MAG: hypothetical protein J2O48_09365 [Solirubrobacterales bacterium]|nr:hypothetical protein [Solirubrobacterales bacterium]